MISAVIRRGAAALLVLALSACVEAPPLARDAVSTAPVTPSANYRLLDDICDRLDHSWLVQLTGVSPQFKYFEPLPSNVEDRECHVSATARDEQTVVRVEVSTILKRSEPAEPEPSESGWQEFSKLAEPLEGVGAKAWFMFDRPDLRPGQAMFRRDLVFVLDGPTSVRVAIMVGDSPLPDESEIKATLTAYVKRILDLMMGGE
ncbi:hypothetical protein [Salinispora mooreana]|uniref:hypothetical protein n=1 Tax=Salinispora mooreana TaxID=999545 RepID=UPI001CC5C51E|nr:hypothetical protein [Salinispora mooreana]